jgi:hypothetical protein
MGIIALQMKVFCKYLIEAEYQMLQTIKILCSTIHKNGNVVKDGW